jgi:thiol:disulfide interchange protein DsbD
MIPITISIIGAKSAENKKSKAFFLSLSYVLGIALTYASLGVIAATTGTFFGSLLGNKYVVVVICLIFIALALSMFGLFEIQAPRFIRNSLGTKKLTLDYLGLL